MQRLLDFGSYQTARTMLNRSAERWSTRPSSAARNLAWPSAAYSARRWWRSPSSCASGAAACGRARMGTIPNAEAQSLRAFLDTTVDPGSTVVTDGWGADPNACSDSYVHEPHLISGSGHKAHELAPVVHRVASFSKRWLLGTHQGRVEADHLQAYLDEFRFRFKRRRSRDRGLLFYHRLMQYSAGAPRTTYRQLVPHPRSKAINPPGLQGPRSRPTSLDQPPADRTWRASASLD